MEDQFIVPQAGTSFRNPVENQNFPSSNHILKDVADGFLSGQPDAPPVVRGYHLCGCLPYRFPKRAVQAAVVLAILLHPGIANSAGPLAITEIAAHESQGHEW